MIRSLRRRHGWMFVVLALVLPLLFLLGVFSRPAMPVMEQIPEPLVDASGDHP